jgi:hypothetical protein
MPGYISIGTVCVSLALRREFLKGNNMNFEFIIMSMYILLMVVAAIIVAAHTPIGM